MDIQLDRINMMTLKKCRGLKQLYRFSGARPPPPAAPTQLPISPPICHALAQLIQQPSALWQPNPYCVTTVVTAGMVNDATIGTVKMASSRSSEARDGSLFSCNILRFHLLNEPFDGFLLTLRADMIVIDCLVPGGSVEVAEQGDYADECVESEDGEAGQQNYRCDSHCPQQDNDSQRWTNSRNMLIKWAVAT